MLLTSRTKKLEGAAGGISSLSVTRRKFMTTSQHGNRSMTSITSSPFIAASDKFEPGPQMRNERRWLCGLRYGYIYSMYVLIMNFIDSGAGAPTGFAPVSSDPLGREKPIVRQAEGSGVCPSRKSRARKQRADPGNAPWSQHPGRRWKGRGTKNADVSRYSDLSDRR